MSQLEDQEFYLSRKIDEAHKVIAELQAKKLELQAEVQAVTGTVDSFKRDLRKAANEAQHTMGHIQGHKLWKTTVREVFGEDGLRRVIARMQNAEPPPASN